MAMPLVLSPSGAQLGPKSNLGPSCAILEPSWAEVRALLAEVGPKWSRCCRHVGSKRCIWTTLCRYAKCANVQITTAGTDFWRLAGANMTPPAEAAPDWQIGPFVSRPAKLPGFGAFGAGGFLHGRWLTLLNMGYGDLCLLAETWYKHDFYDCKTLHFVICCSLNIRHHQCHVLADKALYIYIYIYIYTHTRGAMDPFTAKTQSQPTPTTRHAPMPFIFNVNYFVLIAALRLSQIKSRSCPIE